MTTCRHATCTDEPAYKKAGFCKFHYDKRFRMGLTARVDAEPVLAHVEALRDLGWLFKEIGDAAGVDKATVATMMRLRISTVLRPTAAGILAIPLVPGNANRPVDAAGTRRMLHALNRMGWPQGLVTKRAGVRNATAREAHRETIPFASAAKIAKVYEELSHIPGPSQKTASYAKTMGWLPPLAWDDIDAGVLAEVDEDVESVDEVLVARFLAGHVHSRELNWAEKVDAARRLLAKGATRNIVATRLNWNARSIDKAVA